MVDYIWKSANLEGIPVTFPDTATICDGISVEGKSIDGMDFSKERKQYGNE